MKKIIYAVFVTLAISSAAFAQTNSNNNGQYPNQSSDTLQNISQDIAKIAESVESLNERMKKFTETFSSNQGLKLTDRQQKLLVAFEFLNRAEQRLAVLQNLKVDLTQKQTTIKTRVAKIDEQMRAEAIDRSVAVQGSTNGEELRQMRREQFYKEKSDLTVLLAEMQSTLNDTNNEIRQLESFLKTVRQKLFPEIQREISDL